MNRPRVIPCLLLDHERLVKTTVFKGKKYVGDPVNTIRIFNEKEVDEIMLLDISASKRRSGPDIAQLRQLATECFMPICYGGGLRDLDDVKSVIACGVEKVSINTAGLSNIKFISQTANVLGSSGVVACIDVKRHWFKGYKVWNHTTGRITRLSPVEWALELEQAGAGELVVNSVDRDGTMSGYDIELVREVAAAVRVPVVACGGAASLRDIREAIMVGGAAAAAAGSLFVYRGPHKAVLISYPSAVDIEELLK